MAAAPAAAHSMWTRSRCWASIPTNQRWARSRRRAADGRALAGDDAGQAVALVDATYAATSDLAVGGTIDVGGTDLEIVGIVSSTGSSADTAANVYIPLDVAQDLSGAGDAISTVYVQAESADQIGAVQVGDRGEASRRHGELAVRAGLDRVRLALPARRRSSPTSAHGSRSSSSPSRSALAVLFTISGVSRRTREFGTLKAIGWSNGRVVGQVAGESVVQGMIGGAIGLVVGLAGCGPST